MVDQYSIIWTVKKMSHYIKLKDLEVYQISRQISDESWGIYTNMDWKQQKLMGDQFIKSADSVGANIAEGYARYHLLDQIRFYIIARGSLAEYGYHWLELLNERKIITDVVFSQMRISQKTLEVKLNNLISITRKNAQK